MKSEKHVHNIKNVKILLIITVILSLLGCGSSDSSDSGYVKLYNTANNSPAIYLTIDEDFSTSDDDVEVTYSGVPYGEALYYSQVETGTYFFELAWQDGDSSDSTDLTTVHADNITISGDAIQLIVMSEDVLSPSVMTYNIDIIDEDDDITYDRFNFRVLNMHADSEGIDLYLSKADETFNEASLVGQYAYQELSENIKQDQDDYIFYITKAGNSQVLFQSQEIEFAYSGQYIMAIRENSGVGSSPYILDKVSNTYIESFVDYNAEAKFNAYNAIAPHELLPDYQNNFSLHVNGVDDSIAIENLSFGEVSQPVELAKGDYSIDVLMSGQDEPLLKNHLLSLAENNLETVFLYLDEVAVDDDNDGDVDEDGDGIIDELELNVHSLVVTNSGRSSIYDHEINMVNLVDTDDFSAVTVYFVRHDETIETATYSRSVNFASSNSLYLKNNTYQVYIVARDNSSDIILKAFELVLDEQSNEQFLVIETDESQATGYKVSLFDQGL